MAKSKRRSYRQYSTFRTGDLLFRWRQVRHVLLAGLVVYIFLGVNDIVYHPGHLIRYALDRSFRERSRPTDILPPGVDTYHHQFKCPPKKGSARTRRMSQLHIPRLDKQPELSETTSINSTYIIVNPKKTYRLCDEIEIVIQARDWHNQRKLYGGDYFRARIYTADRYASAASDGDVFDNGDGTYRASFTLRWTGEVKVGVNLIHPSEGIIVLNRLREEVPTRYAYTGRFISKNGNITENVACHVSMENYKGPVCDFSNHETGASWFCAKPQHANLSCSDWIWHEADVPRSNENAKKLLTKSEAMLFYIQKSPIKRLWLHAVNVSWPSENERRLASERELPICTPRMPSSFAHASGYFFQDVWFSNHCQIRRFRVPEALECLQHKTLHFFGDSTVRQFLQLLLLRLGRTLKKMPMDPHVNWKVGPFGLRDETYNISMQYRHHGYPIRNTWTSTWHVDYMVNSINNIQGGPDTIVVVTGWAHFTATNVTYFARRMRSVLKAIQRLHERSPETLVVLRSANTREHEGATGAVYTSDWLAQALDNTMRQIFSQYPKLAFLDLWDMTSSHYSKDRVHPPEVIVANAINQLLTYICPTKLAT